jgi:hypothetical protein
MLPRVSYIPIGGTRAWNDRNAPKKRWWQRDSDFSRYMAGLGFDMLDPEQPFVWTTDLDGVQFWRRWRIFGGTLGTFRDHRDWVSGGENFLRYCVSPRGCIAYEDMNVITHSHGFQVLLYALSFGLKVRRLVAVSPPYRADMEGLLREHRKSIERFTLVLDAGADRVADWGAFGDGIVRRSRIFDADGIRPDQRIAIPGVGHSGVLNERLDQWSIAGIAEALR